MDVLDIFNYSIEGDKMFFVKSVNWTLLLESKFMVKDCQKGLK